ncbi:RNA polymerase sigma factor [Acidobacteriota bacterium]
MKTQNQPDPEIDVAAYYERYAPMVLRRCRLLLKDEARALDAMQEVFTNLLIHKKRLKAQYPSSLLFRMSTNICLNMIRGDRFLSSSDNSDILANIAAFDDSEKALAMRDLLDRLFRKEKPSTREIAVLLFVDGMTLKETAAEVGMSLSGVRKRIRELRQRTRIKKEIYHES